MKLKNLFAVAMASAVLFSCTTEVVKVVEPEIKGTARIKVGINADESSRAVTDHYGAAPTTDELEIYNYAVLIFNSANMLEASLMATPYTALDPNSEQYLSTGLTFDRDLNPNLNDDGTLTVSAGSKKFFAIVNAPLELLEIQEQFATGNDLARATIEDNSLNLEDLSKIIGSYDSTTDDGIVYFNNINTDNRGFMMTTLGTDGYHNQTLLESDDTQAVEIHVGRAMAKVSLASNLEDSDLGSAIAPNGTLDVLSYKIINNPMEMYVIPHVSGNGILTTPYYTRSGVDVNDYFTSENEVQNASQYDLEQYYIPVSKENERTFTYAVENANLHPKQGNSTIAIVKGVFTPGGNAYIADSPLNQGANPAPTFNKGDDFYRIWIPEYENQNTNVTEGNSYDGYYYTQDPTAELNDYIAANPQWPSDIQLEVEYFKDGICYYRLPLKNEKNTLSPYTVKRNSYYMIDIISVADAGYTDEDNGGGVDPTDPLEAQANIEVTIFVDEWEEVEQEGKL